jgi:hypothetical protein
MNLYLVTLKGLSSSTGTNFHDSYVVANSPDAAYQLVRDYLDKNDIGYSYERTLSCVTLMAEDKVIPECRTMLFLPR